MNRSQRWKIAESLQEKAEKYGIACRWHIAQTDTFYLTLDSGEVQAKVRIADHQDCYETSNFNIDPLCDERSAVRAWIEANGTKPARKSRIADDTQARATLEAAGLQIIDNGRGLVHAVNADEVVQVTIDHPRRKAWGIDKQLSVEIASMLKYSN